MTFKTAPRVYETSITTGAGDYTLDGAQVGFQSFSAGIGANNLCEYFATDDTNWEEGVGTVLTGPNRLSRTTITGSSNGGAAVNWGAGTRKLRCGKLAVLGVPRALSLSVAGGAGTTVLTQDQQRRHVLEFTGALTGNRIMEVDATPWEWVVYNNTSGAFTLTFRVTGQAGLAVTQGKRRSVHCDGVDARDSVNDPLSSEFAAGTRMTFQQTAAPTGWTKETSATYNDAAFRITTGTVGTGGADVFTTVFGTGMSTAGFTLTTAEIPAHTHAYRGDSGGAGVGDFINQAGSNNPNSTTENSSPANTGGGGAHSHTISNLNLKYADVIIAAKD